LRVESERGSFVWGEVSLGAREKRDVGSGSAEENRRDGFSGANVIVSNNTDAVPRESLESVIFIGSIF